MKKLSFKNSNGDKLIGILSNPNESKENLIAVLCHGFATKRKEEVDKINSGFDFKQEIDETVKEYGKKLFPAINVGYLQRWISALR